MRMYVCVDRGRFPVDVCVPVVATNGKHTGYTGAQSQRKTRNTRTQRHVKYCPTLVLHFTHLWSKHTFNLFQFFLNASKSNVLTI